MTHESFDRGEPVGRSSNRVFGFVFATFFLIVGLFPLLGGGGVRVWSAGVSAAFLLLALVVPKALGPLNALWMRFGQLLHHVVNPIVLGILFYFVVTPTGLVMRLLGKDLLRLRFDRSAKSYWIERRPPGPRPDSLNHQF